MRINDKGRVTIPPELRERYGLSPGTEIDLVATPAGLLIRPMYARGGPANGHRVEVAADEFVRLTSWDRG